MELMYAFEKIKNNLSPIKGDWGTKLVYRKFGILF